MCHLIYRAVICCRFLKLIHLRPKFTLTERSVLKEIIVETQKNAQLDFILNLNFIWDHGVCCFFLYVTWVRYLGTVYSILRIPMQSFDQFPEPFCFKIFFFVFFFRCLVRNSQWIRNMAPKHYSLLSTHLSHILLFMKVERNSFLRNP